MRERLARLPGAERRDAELQAQVRPFEDAMIRKAQEHAQRGVVDPELEKLRWMIEEFRVSLWAQKLGTTEPVSAKRLEKQWARVR
jgi:ATP-dependent helicase HrpA